MLITTSQFLQLFSKVQELGFHYSFRKVQGLTFNYSSNNEGEGYEIKIYCSDEARTVLGLYFTEDGDSVYSNSSNGNLYDFDYVMEELDFSLEERKNRENEKKEERERFKQYLKLKEEFAND